MTWKTWKSQGISFCQTCGNPVQWFCIILLFPLCALHFPGYPELLEPVTSPGNCVFFFLPSVIVNVQLNYRMLALMSNDVIMCRFAINKPFNQSRSWPTLDDNAHSQQALVEQRR